MSEEKSLIPAEEMNMQVQAAVNAAMEPMARMYKAMTDAMLQMSASMRAMQETMDELQRESRMRAPLTGVQKRHIDEAIRERAKGVADRHGMQEAFSPMCKDIRRKLCRRWGVRSVAEIPSCEYAAALDTVAYWDETDMVMKYAKE